MILCAQKQVKKASAVLVCATAPIACYALFNYKFYGTPLGLHVLYNHAGFNLSKRQAAFALGTLLLCTALTLFTRKGKAAPALKQHIYAFLPALFIPFAFLYSAFSPASSLLLAFPVVLFIVFGISERMEELLSEPMSLGNILFVAITGFLFLVSCIFADNPDTTVRYCLSVQGHPPSCLQTRSGRRRGQRRVHFRILIILGTESSGPTTTCWQETRER